MAKQTSIVIVGGCGHVGLPLGIVMADRLNAQVTLLDIDPEKVSMVNSGVMPFIERGADEVLRRVIGNKLTATLDPACLANAEIAITVVGTPVDRHLNPMLNSLHRNIDEIITKLPD